MKRILILITVLISFIGCEMPTEEDMREIAEEVLENSLDETADDPEQEPERQEEPEPEPEPQDEPEETQEPVVIEEVQEPIYSNTVYSLSGYERSSTQSFIVNEESVVIDGSVFLIDDLPYVIDGDTRIIQIGIEVDFKDSFLFIPSVCPDFFGIDLTRMNRIELECIADVIRRYPEETIFDLGDEWNVD